MAPIRLRAHLGDAAHKVTWLELFFDLIFVAAVAQVAEPLHDDYSIAGVFRFATLFALIWWAWTGYTAFATRFHADDALHRLLMPVQMFVVAAMAANAEEQLHSQSSAGFMAAYGVLRLILIGQYLRARHVPAARALTLRYVAGYGTAAAIWLVSALQPAPWRYVLWAAAFAIDLGTPWLTLRHAIRVPPNPAHLPERIGLFTLILLGESVVAVMRGMRSQPSWAPVPALTVFGGMALLFLVWWWYFDVAAAASERFVRTRRDAVRFNVWTYAHFPLYVGLVVIAVGLQRSVTAGRWAFHGEEAVLITSAALGTLMAMAVISGTLDRRPGNAAAWLARGLEALTQQQILVTRRVVVDRSDHLEAVPGIERRRLEAEGHE